MKVPAHRLPHLSTERVVLAVFAVLAGSILAAAFLAGTVAVAQRGPDVHEEAARKARTGDRSTESEAPDRSSGENEARDDEAPDDAAPDDAARQGTAARQPERELPQAPPPRDPSARTPADRKSVPKGHVLIIPPTAAEPRIVAAFEDDGVTWIAAADAAGVLRATRYWRPETRKLLLRIGEHRVRLGVDNPFWIVDDVAHHLPAPRLRAGAVWVPLSFLELTAKLGIIRSASWDPEARILDLGAGAHSLGPISLEEEGDRTRFSIHVKRGIQPRVMAAALDRFVVDFPYAVAAPSIIGSAQALGRFRHIDIIQRESGVVIEMQLAGRARGYALRSAVDPMRIEILVSDSWGRHGGFAFQPFDIEAKRQLAESDGSETGDGGELGDGDLDGDLDGDGDGDSAAASSSTKRHVVIDAGHGGEDEGSRAASGQLEKHLTLELAARLQRRLQQSGTLRVTLVRDRDERVDVPRRVELANGLRADLFISLHCDLSGPLSRDGYLVMAGSSGAGEMLYEDVSPTHREGQLDVLSLARWESVGAEQVAASFQVARAIADYIAGAFPKSRGHALSRPLWNLEGAHMPAVMVELGALDRSANGDPGELMKRPAFMNAAVDAIADGIEDALSIALGAGDSEGGSLSGEKF